MESEAAGDAVPDALVALAREPAAPLEDLAVLAETNSMPIRPPTPPSSSNSAARSGDGSRRSSSPRRTSTGRSNGRAPSSPRRERSVDYATNVLVSGVGFGRGPWQCLVEVFVGDVDRSPVNDLNPRVGHAAFRGGILVVGTRERMEAHRERFERAVADLDRSEPSLRDRFDAVIENVDEALAERP